MKKAKKSSKKLPLLERFKLNKRAQMSRLDALDKEIDRAIDRGEVPPSPTQDRQYLALRREYEDLEREFDKRNLQRFAARPVVVYGGEGGRTVVGASARRPRRTKKAKTKAKARVRIRF